MSDRAILVDRKVVPESDLLVWGRWMQSAERVVGKTELPNDVLVSTVFLGLDHGYTPDTPMWFETIIFGGPQDQHTQRYATWEEAERGHQEAVTLATDEAKS